MLFGTEKLVQLPDGEKTLTICIIV